jgi:hypothetical protein
MQQNNEHSLDNLVEKMMQEISIENTSVDFTANLMMRLQTLPAGKSIAYQPLISKTGWVAILIAMLVLIGFIIANSNGTNTDLLNMDGMSHFLMNIKPNINFIKFSSISLYAVLLSSLMILVEITILVNRYQKQLSIQ